MGSACFRKQQSRVAWKLPACWAAPLVVVFLCRSVQGRTLLGPEIDTLAYPASTGGDSSTAQGMEVSASSSGSRNSLPGNSSMPISGSSSAMEGPSLSIWNLSLLLVTVITMLAILGLLTLVCCRKMALSRRRNNAALWTCPSGTSQWPLQPPMPHGYGPSPLPYPQQVAIIPQPYATGFQSLPQSFVPASVAAAAAFSRTSSFPRHRSPRVAPIPTHSVLVQLTPLDAHSKGGSAHGASPDQFSSNGSGAADMATPKSQQYYSDSSNMVQQQAPQGPQQRLSHSCSPEDVCSDQGRQPEQADQQQQQDELRKQAR